MRVIPDSTRKPSSFWPKIALSPIAAGGVGGRASCARAGAATAKSAAKSAQRVAFDRRGEKFEDRTGSLTAAAPARCGPIAAGRSLPNVVELLSAGRIEWF